MLTVKGLLVGLVMTGATLVSAGPKDSATSARATYKVTANFRNVKGLKVGSEVSTSGVTVGRVARIELLNERLPDGSVLFVSDQVRVTLLLLSKYKFPADMNARILSLSPLGHDKYIDLEGGGANDSVMTDGYHMTSATSVLIFEDLLSHLVGLMAHEHKD